MREIGSRFQVGSKFGMLRDLEFSGVEFGNPLACLLHTLCRYGEAVPREMLSNFPVGHVGHQNTLALVVRDKTVSPQERGDPAALIATDQLRPKERECVR